MPTSTAWSRPTTEPGFGAAHATLASLLPGGPETDAALEAGAEQARLAALAAGRSAALAALVSEVLATLAADLDAAALPGDLIEQVAEAGSVDAEALALAVAGLTFPHPLIATLPPSLAVTAVLELLVLIAPVGYASLWRRNCTPGVDCFVHAGQGCPTRSVRDAARRALRSPSASQVHGLLRVLPVPRRDDAVIVARPTVGGRWRCLAFLQLAAAAVTPQLEGLTGIERDASSGELLAGASERRLARIGFDLHDGPVQGVAALLGEARLLQTQLRALGDDERMERVSDRVGDLTARVVAVEFELRSVCQSLAAPASMCRPFEGVIEQEVVTFQRLTGTRPRLELNGRFDTLSESQRVALIRIVQEALRNVREHSRARNVAVMISAGRRDTQAIVFDDGCGFDPDAAIARAIADGHVGLTGMIERVRLLGGSCSVRSRIDGPTTVAVTLPRWQPGS
jgi:signal transduction histidine kinase